jgi:hypothetical protein
MKIIYKLDNNKKLQKRLNLQATMTEKQITFYKLSQRSRYQLRYSENRLYA